ncbi:MULTISPECIES: hypothetical protein [Bacteria]|uniref:hypothetical protein n=1 Tax=Bacteria TaxID=2 RepID=UPI00062101CB|nr:hypothetical protein [Leucobacter sp. Ag1]KKI20579.1 hypothetical protein XM48_07645 [Leucobacter sp. Ag1]
MTSTTTADRTWTPTPLDDLKDFYSLSADRIGFALDFLGATHEIYSDETSELGMLEEVQATAARALAKYIPGMNVDDRTGLVTFDNDEARQAANTYDDGTPVEKRLEFEDVKGLSFTYRPRHDKMPWGEFLEWAREHAEKWKAEQHDRYASAGELGIEYVGIEDEPFQLHLGDDAHAALDRAQVKVLRDGLTRILATQARAGEATESEAGGAWAHAEEISGGQGFVYVATFYGGENGKPGVVIQSNTGTAPRPVEMSPFEARHLAALILERADAAEHKQHQWTSEQ